MPKRQDPAPDGRQVVTKVSGEVASQIAEFGNRMDMGTAQVVRHLISIGIKHLPEIEKSIIERDNMDIKTAKTMLDTDLLAWALKHDKLKTIRPTGGGEYVPKKQVERLAKKFSRI